MGHIVAFQHLSDWANSYVSYLHYVVFHWELLSIKVFEIFIQLIVDIHNYFVVL